jgi:hypothetical protein
MKVQLGAMSNYNFSGFSVNDPMSVKFDTLSTKP